MIKTCWVCSGSSFSKVKSSNIKSDITAQSFAITDKKYGVTLDIFKCRDCGFLQCHNFPDVLKYYEDMEDEGYEDSSKQRMIQMKRIVKSVKKYKKTGKFLDVGAGSGLLVSEAKNASFEAEGVEPSVWLQKIAEKKGLNVHLGILSDMQTDKSFDIISIIDVIEHVESPLSLLEDVKEKMNDGSIGIIVTPDCKSFMAKLLGWNWWHYRVAHIGYFDENTIKLILKKSGFRILSITRPNWYFPADYLIKRLSTYLPFLKFLPLPKFLSKITVPLNLFDSMQIIIEKDKE